MALAASACWGVSDFVTAGAARRIGVLATLVYSEAIGALLLCVVVAADPGLVDGFGGDRRLLSWTLLVALFHLAGIGMMIYAFRNGVLSVVSPIVASFSAGTVALTLLFGAGLSDGVIAGLVILIAGIVTAATPSESSGGLDPAGHPLAVPAAIGSSVMFSVMFWILETRVAPATSAIGAIWGVRVASTLVLGSVLLVVPSRGGGLRVPRASLPLLAGIAVLEVGAYLFVALGSAYASPAIVTTFSSLFSPITVMLAWHYYGDRLSWRQWCGVGAIIAGIVVVNLFS